MTMTFLAASAATMTLLEAWEHGGWVMWVLLGMSVIGATFCLYFLATLRERAVAPRRLRRDLPSYLLQADTTEARRLCEDTPSPLSAVMIATLDAVRSAPCASAELISKVAESEGARQSDLIQGQTQWLLEIATIAPMVGLLGTVMGMLSAFGAVASDLAAAKPTLLAEGVSQAIITTIFGLFVAIPAMMMYAFFRRRAAKLVATLESACAELVAVLTSKHAQD
ncbi:MAG: MotA/TolQ/ExbB proton channel family protein [Kiritimatiellae bacterium]|nr:MotA/TolQ/ExbB proton channel family protein [Kiritimatiellia bacterium]MBR4946468.1 MotA/TolQ/ExbB proton channel family protein [Kiritimatiellia bacterium]